MGNPSLVVGAGYNMDFLGLRHSDVLDLMTLEMKNVAGFPVKKWDGVSVPYKNTVLAVGGWNGTDQNNSILEWDPINEEWIQRPEVLKTARSDFTAFMIPDGVVTCS